jgi:hypothetical protein
MTQFGSMTASMDIGNRLCRLPLVLLVTVSLLFSLLHCATCDLDFANTNGAVTVVSMDQKSTPDTPSTCRPITAFSRHGSAIERVCRADRSHPGCAVVPASNSAPVIRPSSPPPRA